MYKITCDLCFRDNAHYGNQEIWTQFSYFGRSGFLRIYMKKEICLNCLSKIEDLMDSIIKGTENDKETN